MSNPSDFYDATLIATADEIQTIRTMPQYAEAIVGSMFGRSALARFEATLRDIREAEKRAVAALQANAVNGMVAFAADPGSDVTFTPRTFTGTLKAIPANDNTIGARK